MVSSTKGTMYKWSRETCLFRQLRLEINEHISVLWQEHQKCHVGITNSVCYQHLLIHQCVKNELHSFISYCQKLVCQLACTCLLTEIYTCTHMQDGCTQLDSQLKTFTHINDAGFMLESLGSQLVSSMYESVANSIALEVYCCEHTLVIPTPTDSPVLLKTFSVYIAYMTFELLSLLLSCYLTSVRPYLFLHGMGLGTVPSMRICDPGQDPRSYKGLHFSEAGQFFIVSELQEKGVLVGLQDPDSLASFQVCFMQKTTAILCK